MRKIQINPAFILLLTLVLVSFVSAQSTGVQTSPPSDPKAECEKSGGSWYAPLSYCAHCPEGTSLTSYSEESPSSPTGVSTTLECKKRVAGNIQSNLQSFINGTSTGDVVSTIGEVVSLDTSEDKPQSPETNLTSINQSNITEGLSNITNLFLDNQPEECSGCLLNESCYPVNNVKDNKYCSIDKEWMGQKNDNEFCENNFECQSNLCVNKACINQGFLQKIIDWFTKFFG